MSKVFVLDTNKQPLNPIHPGRARMLLSQGKAAVFRRYPVRYCSRSKFHKGFQTGDIVKAVVTSGKKIGTYVGRVATRATGSFNISTADGLVQGISHKYCTPIHKKDGYAYVA